MANQTGIAYLEKLKKRGSVLGLENMMSLMEALGNPEKHLKIIHVAGTNGKGSVCNYMTHILEKAGYSVGSFNSPHLINVNECYRINNQEIEDEELEGLIEAIKPSVKALEKKGKYATYFEVLVAMALIYFVKEEVDYVVMEVGLGGRMDATNVITDPILSVITKIGIDHIDVLGNNLEDIAYEKAGIIKHNIPVVSYTQKEDAMKVIKNVAKSQESELITAALEDVTEIELNRKGTRFTYKGIPYQLQMIGRHQIENAIIAIESIKKLDIGIESDSIESGLYNSKWCGRLERINEQPDIYIDGAHNVDGIIGLKETIKVLDYPTNIGVIGVLGDKEVDEIVQLIAPVLDKIVVTKPNNSRALDPKILYDKIKGYHTEVILEPNIQEAVKEAVHLVKDPKKDAIIGFGSLYMIGEIKQIVERGI